MGPQLDGQRRVLGEVAALNQVAEETAHRREAAALAGDAKFARGQILEISGQAGAVDGWRSDPEPRAKGPEIGKSLL